MPFLVMLGLAGAVGVGTGLYVFRKGTEDKDLTPTIGGVPAVPALAIGGGLMALMLGGAWAPIGLGIAIGSLVAGGGLMQTKEGLKAIIAGQLAAAPTPPALPGPNAAAPAPEPKQAPAFNLFKAIFPKAAEAANNAAQAVQQ